MMIPNFKCLSYLYEMYYEILSGTKIIIYPKETADFYYNNLINLHNKLHKGSKYRITRRG